MSFWYSRRFIIASIVVLALLTSACLVLVSPGEAIVITRFTADPVRVIASAPGLSLKLAIAPIDNAVPVDLRLRTTSSGLHDVGTRDGLRVLVQAYIAWQVPGDREHVQQFLRAVRNQPAIAAEQLRSFTGSALEITASSFDLAALVNTDPVQESGWTLSRRRCAAASTIRRSGFTASTGCARWVWNGSPFPPRP